MANEPLKILESPDKITAVWLTAAMRGAGISDGVVRGFTTRANPAFNSAVAHLELTYSVGAQGPTHVVCKIAKNESGKGEVEFYNSVRDRHNLPMVVRCFYAAHDGGSGVSNLILEDVSRTHGPPVDNGRVGLLTEVPGEVVTDGIAEALGAFHGRWWESEAMRSRGFALVRPWYRDEGYFRRHCERRRREWDMFSSSGDGEVPGAVRGMYERTLAGMPGLWDRLVGPRVTELRGLTVTHGDCYLGQFLCPREGTSGRTYLADFGDVSGNFGPYDLVYAFCTFWTRAQRGEAGREHRLLRRYYDALIGAGVKGYSWEQLLADYRLMILFMIFDPVWNQTGGTNRGYWWPKMRCLTEAYEDWECGRLLTKST